MTGRGTTFDYKLPLSIENCDIYHGNNLFKKRSKDKVLM